MAELYQQVAFLWGNRGITVEALKESGWVNGLYLSKIRDWPFKSDSKILISIRLKRFSYHLIEDIEQAASFTCISKITTRQVFVWKDPFLILQKIASSPSKLQYLLDNGSTRNKTSVEKLMILAQSESFHVEYNALHKKCFLKKSSRIASFAVQRSLWSSPFHWPYSPSHRRWVYRQASHHFR